MLCDVCRCWGKRINDMHRSELSRKVCGRLVRGGIAAEMNVRQAYTVKHIRKALTLLGQGERKLLW